MKVNFWKSGDWNAICDVCGWRFKMSKLKKRWDGLLVCSDDFEHRHIADFIKIPEERNNILDTRPEPPDTFVPIIYGQQTHQINGAMLNEVGIN